METHSQALTKRESDTSLMPPPPPPKRIKRPATILEEDVYTEALSHIIARDYFPGLLEAQVKQEYLDALDSKDKKLIASSRKKLTDLLMTPGRSRPHHGSGNVTPNLRSSGKLGDTPMGVGGDTPMSVVSAATTTATEATQKDIPDISKMGLLEFQAKYTSDDNESFNKLLDKQNTKRREKHAWLWSENKIPTARQIAHRQREAKRIEALGGNPDSQKKLEIKTNLDARPAKPDTWKVGPKNSLMFMPSSVEDSHETIQQAAEAASRAGPKRVVFNNTRLPEEIAPDANAPPPSPSISAIQDAIAGRPRPTDSEPGYTGGETPRVNGYAFVDDEEPDVNHAPEDEKQWEDLRLLGNSDATPNPFQIKANRRREDLHHRMVDRVARTKRAEKMVKITKTPVTSTPRFASSPRLDFGLRTPGAATPGGNNKSFTPAAQMLLHQMGSTPRRTGASSSTLKNMWTPTIKRSK